MTNSAIITSRPLRNWKELQRESARILRECGFSVNEPFTVETARGTVEVDVHAEEYLQGRKNVILCECKYWKTGVPKNVIHGFRTVMADIGANIGYIIAPAGFQSGAGPAAEYTNIELVTWERFQEIFAPIWMRHQWVKEAEEILKLVIFFSSADDGDDFARQVRGEDKDVVVALCDEYLGFAAYVLGQAEARRWVKSDHVPSLPLAELPDEHEFLPTEVVHANCLRGFLAAERAHALQGAKRLLKILQRNNHSQTGLLQERIMRSSKSTPV